MILSGEQNRRRLVTREVPNAQASDPGRGLSYRYRNESVPPAHPGPLRAGFLHAVGKIILWAGLLPGVPLGVFVGLIAGSRDSGGVVILTNVTFGLLVCAAPPISVGAILLRTSRVIRKRAATPGL